MIRSSTISVLVLVALAGLAGAGLVALPARADAAPSDAGMQQPAARDEFVPVAELPPDEQLPAAPLLVGAYAFAWVMILVYLLMLWRRVGRVEREVADVARQVGEKRRA
jgi:CcmD family protein